MTKRNLWQMTLFILITLGIYGIYWLVVTKNELNGQGAKIPTAWLLLIPFVNFYFAYKFTQAFCALILKNTSFTIPYFILFLIIWPFSEIIFQFHINKKKNFLF